MPTKDKQALAAWVPTALAEALRKRATDAERTVSAEVRIALRAYLEPEQPASQETLELVALRRRLYRYARTLERIAESYQPGGAGADAGNWARQAFKHDESDLGEASSVDGMLFERRLPANRHMPPQGS